MACSGSITQIYNNEEMFYLLENGVKDRENESVKFVPTVCYTRDLSDLNQLVKSGVATPEEILEFNQRFAALKAKTKKNMIGR